MHRRLREARLALNLKQKEVAERLGMKATSFANWEAGCSPVPKSKIPLVCQQLKLNETWLRTGEGEMFASAPASSPESTANLPSPFEYAQAQGCSEAIAEIFARYCALPDEKKAVFAEIVDSLVKKKKNRASNATVSVNNVYGDNNTTIN